MQSILDILDSKRSLGFSYFHDWADEGYLRRMLQTNPSLAEIYARLEDDIELVSKITKEDFSNKAQFKAFKKLEKYLKEAKDYIKEKANEKKKKIKAEQKEIEDEIKQLDKEYEDGLLDDEDYDHAVKMLRRIPPDNLEEVKNKFEVIDHKVKQELKKFGYEKDLENEEEDDTELLDFTGEDEQDEYGEFAAPMESVNIDKLVDENNRRYTMEEFNDIYEAMEVQTKTVDPVQKNIDLKAQQLKKAEIQKIMSDAMKTKKPMTPREAEKIYADRQAARSNSNLK